MMKTQLTVIVPIYNVEKYLNKCLDSLINQTFSDMEIILIDDGSPDNCGEICDEYAKKDKRIVVIHKQNEGLCAARNEGIARASGKWIAFVDSDDWCETDYYENMFRELRTLEVDVFMAGGHFQEFDNGQVVKYNSHEGFFYNSRQQLDVLMAKVLAPQCGAKGDGVNASSAGSPWDKLYRTEFIRTNQLLFDRESKAWEDLLFNFYVFDKAKSVAAGKCIGYHYRMINSSITKSYNPKREEINYYFIDKLQMYMAQRGENSLIQKAIYVRSINMISNLMRCYYFHPANEESYRETAKRIKSLKKKKYYRDAIMCRKNELFSKRQYFLKIVLETPFVLPLKLITEKRGN